MSDVAALAGTSTAVVSYVLNDGPRPVATATRARVVEAIETLGYRPNRVAQALRSQRSGQLGLIVPNLASQFFVQLVQAVEQAAFGRNELLVVGSAGYEARHEQAYFEAFVDTGVDAIIVATVSQDPPRDDLIEGTRVVWLHHRPVGAAGPFVDIDNEGAGRSAMEHLLSHGAKRPLVLTGPTDVGPVGLRLTGALRAGSDAGIDRGSIRVLRSEFSRFDAAEKLHSFSEPFDGVLTTTDEQGIGVLAALARQVPDPVAVVSIDGTEASSCLAPPLTTVEVPIRAMAERAIDLALAPSPEIRSHRFAVSLRIGGSCGCEADAAPGAG